jgi:hypothetical protein
MRVIPGQVSLLLLASPPVASGQSFVVQGSGGPTLVETGYSLAGGIGFLPISRVALLVDVERTHLSSQVRSDGRGGVSGFRGGTLTLMAAQLRVAPLGHERVGPYGLAGFAAGVSRPNVTELFPERVTNDVRAIFFGGGIHVPLKERISLFADGRMMVGTEAGELLAVAPLRAGLAWRF